LEIIQSGLLFEFETTLSFGDGPLKVRFFGETVVPGEGLGFEMQSNGGKVHENLPCSKLVKRNSKL